MIEHFMTKFHSEQLSYNLLAFLFIEGQGTIQEVQL